MNFEAMNLPLIICLVGAAVPVFFGRIAHAPLWLSLQALALGWIALHRHHEIDLHAIEAGLEVLLVRAWLVPALLRRALRAHPSAADDLMPSNLFAWGVALALIILAFNFGDGARADARAMTLGVAAATVMMAFLVLATNAQPMAQLVGVLLMENAIALCESLMPEPWPLPVHLGLSAVYVATVSVGRWLAHSAYAEPARDPSLQENT